MKFPFSKGKKKMTKQNTASQVDSNEQQPENVTDVEQTPAEPTLESLQERIAELEGMLQDEQLRALANEQNLRRRHQEELQAAYKFAAQKFATEMLIVKDYLEMALLDNSGNVDAMKMGVTMTLNELKKVFENAQIKEITAQVGSKLDPYQHQAMQEVDAPEQEAGTIVTVRTKGYTLHDRVLRPTMVTVAKATQPENQ